MSFLVLLATVLANLFPLYGALYLGWNAFSLLTLFWLEDGAILLFHLPRLLLTASVTPEERLYRRRLIYLSMMGLACLTAVHGFALFYLFAIDRVAGAPTLELPPRQDLLWFLLLLVVSHAVAFVLDFLGEREYRQTSLTFQALLPLPRVLVLATALVLGGLVARADGGLRSLVVLVFGKTLLDLVLRALEQARRPRGAALTRAGYTRPS